MADKRKTTRTGGSSAAAAWFCGGVMVIELILVGSIYSKSGVAGGGVGNRLVFDRQRPCEEIYVVGEGETLNTISDKCGDPFIVERNPHIHDPDDVFPGLVIKITPSDPTRRT